MVLTVLRVPARLDVLDSKCFGCFSPDWINDGLTMASLLSIFVWVRRLGMSTLYGHAFRPLCGTVRRPDVTVF